jgi:sugar phosphate isomerase/epimerase
VAGEGLGPTPVASIRTSLGAPSAWPRHGGSPRPRVGIDGRKIPEAARRGPIGSLEHARELGLDGVFFRTVLDMSPQLDPGVLSATRDRAVELGLYLEAGLGKINPFATPEAPELRRIGDGDIVAGYTRMMQACAAIGCRELWVGTANYKSNYRGRLAYDRFRTDVTWDEQLRAIARFLGLLAPIAADLDIHLNIETHEEITSFEVVGLVESVGPEVAGIVFDPGNVLQRLEHPLWAASRVAPYVRQTHLKDAAVLPQPGGLGYQMRPYGTGVVDFAAIVPLLLRANPSLHLTMENDQPRAPGDEALTMLIEIEHPEFVSAHPDVSEDELAAYYQLVLDYEERIAREELPDLATWARTPYGYPECVRSIREGARMLRALGDQTTCTQ